MDAKQIHELITGYGLWEALLNRLEIVVVGGVARSTVYKAFQQGGTTPRTKTVIRVAKEVIEEHEKNVSSEVLAIEPAA